MRSKYISLLIIFGAVALGARSVWAQETSEIPVAPPVKTIGQVSAKTSVSSLAVINSGGATLENGKLTLTGVSRNSIIFADRPVRAAGHVTTEELVKQWSEGPDSLSIDPPNATISVLAGSGSAASDAVVTLKDPKLDGANLVFDVTVLEGSLAGATGPAALFIDHWHGRGAWYGVGLATGAVLGAAVNAAAGGPVYLAPPPPPPPAPYYYPPYYASPYYHPYPHCGYYPYGPCY